MCIIIDTSSEKSRQMHNLNLLAVGFDCPESLARQISFCIPAASGGESRTGEQERVEKTAEKQKTPGFQFPGVFV